MIRIFKHKTTIRIYKHDDTDTRFHNNRIRILKISGPLQNQIQVQVPSLAVDYVKLRSKSYIYYIRVLNNESDSSKYYNIYNVMLQIFVKQKTNSLCLIVSQFHSSSWKNWWFMISCTPLRPKRTERSDKNLQIRSLALSDTSKSDGNCNEFWWFIIFE